MKKLFKWLRNKYFGFWFYFGLGRRPFDDYMGILSQVSNIAIIFVFVFGIDIKKYPIALFVAILGMCCFYVMVGKLYKFFGWQKEEDYLHNKLNPVADEKLDHLRVIRKYIDEQNESNSKRTS